MENLDAETANAFLRRAAEAFLVLDHDGLIRWANPRARRLFGYGLDDLLGRPIDLVLPGASADVRDPSEPGKEGAAESPPSPGRELTASRSDGATFPVEASLSPLPPVGAARTLCVVEDLTPRRAYETDLRKLSNAVEQTADTVFITDRDGTIEYVNPAFESTTGFSREEALGKTPRILKSGLQEAEYYQRLWSAILSGTSFHATVVNRKKSGELYHAEQTITPMKDTEGQITHFVSVLRDMTETIRLREQETESNLARKIQRRLFPAEAPRLDGFDIAGGVFPAAATCGDYFDFVPMADGELGVVVADACGHGMGPALIMAETRAYLHAAARTESDPYEVLHRIHRALFADLDERDYVTMILACIDPKARLLRFASAGHVSALLLGPDGALLRELASTGRPLGAVAELAMERTEPLTLSPGNILVFLTDGILETDSPDADEFGLERTLEVVARNRQATARQIVDRLHDEVQAFAHRASLADDLTAVVCKVL